MTATLTKPQIMRAIRVRTINKGKAEEETVRLIFQRCEADNSIAVSFAHHLPHAKITAHHPLYRDLFEHLVRSYLMRTSDQALTLARRAAVRRHIPRRKEDW